MSILNISAAAPARAGFFSRLVEGLQRARATQAQYAIYRQTVRELSNLSDRELVDMGINPRKIEVAAREAAFKL